MKANIGTECKPRYLTEYGNPKVDGVFFVGDYTGVPPHSILLKYRNKTYRQFLIKKRQRPYLSPTKKPVPTRHVNANGPGLQGILIWSLIHLHHDGRPTEYITEFITLGEELPCAFK